MKIIVETSTLIGACLFWKSGSHSIKHRQFDRCNSLFQFLERHPEVGIVTRTVENEAKGVLDKAVLRTIGQAYFSDIREKIRIMTLQHIVTNDCLDKLERLIEECSTRLPIDTKERDRIKADEIAPFLQDIVTKTVRYLQPHIPAFITGQGLREELTDVIVKSLPSKGVVYKGMPADRDLTIMAEATLIHRKYRGKKKIYVASMDQHFIPNKVQIGSFLSGYKKFLPDELDSTVRDKLATEFGFIGDDPLEVLKAAQKEITEP